MNMSSLLSPALGFGLGLRPVHYEAILQSRPRVDWFEIISENYMVPGGKPWHFLDRIREHYPLVMHGVSLSIGSTDPLNRDYLRQLKQLMERVEPRWISDHLCWTGAHSKNMHDLLPLPYTTEAVEHVAGRVREVQDFLGRRILLENVSSYVTYKQSDMTEWEFLNAVVERADCLLLLDVNNIYVSSFNHGFGDGSEPRAAVHGRTGCGFDPLEYLNAVPVGRVQQFHLAGHRNLETHIVDTHDEPIADPVWELYAAAVRRFGAVSTMIERDDNIPELTELVAELAEARRIAAEQLENRAFATA